jgi:hypothetical protein
MMRRGVMGAVLAGVVAAGAGAPAAHAGTYAGRTCGNGAQAGLTQVKAGPAFAWRFSNTCGQGGGSGYRATSGPGTVPAGASATAKLSARPGTRFARLSGVVAGAARAARAYTRVFARNRDGSVQQLLGANGPFGGQVQGGPWTFGTEVTAIESVAGCFAGGSACAPAGEAANDAVEFTIRDLQYTLEDLFPPEVAGGGAGWSGAPIDGAETVTWSAKDVGLGVRSVELLVDGRSLGTQPASCPGFGARPDPCPLAASGSFVLDTTQLTEREHLLELRATDAGGEVGVARQTIFVDNVKGEPEDVAQRSARVLLSTGTRTLRAGYGRSVLLRGRVVDAAGVNVGGAGLLVRVQPRIGGLFTEVARTATAPDGTFAVRVPAGPSRRIEVVSGGAR